MTQQPLFDLPPALPPSARTVAALQTLVDALTAGKPYYGAFWVEYRRYRGFYLCGEPRYFGDSGCDYLGVYANDAAARIRELVR